MNTKTYIIAMICLFALVFTSCEKTFFEKRVDDTPKSNFEYLWQQVNDKYAFLDYKEVNWNEIKKIYSAKINDKMSNEELFEVLAEMLNTLKDGHVNLFAPFNVSHYDITKDSKPNLDMNVVNENYLKSDHFITGNFKHNFIDDGKIGYIRYASFESGMISNYELDYILKRYKDTEGLILDIRSNGGGIATNVGELLARFTFSKLLIHTVEAKSGPGANDFTPIKQVYAEDIKYEPEVKEEDKMPTYNKPVAVLIDRGSYSASSFFALSTKAYDKLFLVGDTTGGGLGAPNGGQLPNGWVYRFSITRTLDAHGNNYENGVPPDFVEYLDKAQVAAGKDNVIERAIQEIRKK